MTPEEFENCYKQWRDLQDSYQQAEWERMRLQASIVIQPHLKRKLTAKQLLPLPWDKERAHQKDTPKLTAKERRKRMDALREKLGG